MKNKADFYFAVLFGTIGLIASDTFIPSMMSIAKNFGVSVSIIQGSIAIFMLGFCLARFCVSVLSDGVGRKSMFIVCFSLLFLGSCVCLFATNEHLFIAGRLLQGIGSGGSNVLARVIIRDVTENKDLAKYNALYSMFAVSFMVVAPFFGSLLQTYFNWQAAFIFIALLSIAALLISSLVYQETNIYKKLETIKPKVIATNFMQLLNSPNCVKYASLLFVSFGFMTAWLTSGSVILQEKMNLSYIEFGCCALFVGLFYFMASFLSSKYVGKLGEIKLIFFAVKLLFFPPLLLAFTFLFYDNASISTLIIVLSVAISFFAAGFIIPNAYSLGVKSFPHIAGMAGAFFGFSQIFGGFVYSFIISCSSSYSIFPLLGAMIATVIIARLSILKAFEFSVLGAQIEARSKRSD